MAPRTIQNNLSIQAFDEIYTQIVTEIDAIYFDNDITEDLLIDVENYFFSFYERIDKDEINVMITQLRQETNVSANIPVSVVDLTRWFYKKRRDISTEKVYKIISKALRIEGNLMNTSNTSENSEHIDYKSIAKRIQVATAMLDLIRDNFAIKIIQDVQEVSRQQIFNNNFMRFLSTINNFCKENYLSLLSTERRNDFIRACLKYINFIRHYNDFRSLYENDSQNHNFMLIVNIIIHVVDIYRPMFESKQVLPECFSISFDLSELAYNVASIKESKLSKDSSIVLLNDYIVAIVRPYFKNTSLINLLKKHEIYLGLSSYDDMKIFNVHEICNAVMQIFCVDARSLQDLSLSNIEGYVEKLRFIKPFTKMFAQNCILSITRDICVKTLQYIKQINPASLMYKQPYLHIIADSIGEISACYPEFISFQQTQQQNTKVFCVSEILFKINANDHQQILNGIFEHNLNILENFIAIYSENLPQDLLSLCADEFLKIIEVQVNIKKETIVKILYLIQFITQLVFKDGNNFAELYESIFNKFLVCIIKSLYVPSLTDFIKDGLYYEYILQNIQEICKIYPDFMNLFSLTSQQSLCQNLIEILTISQETFSQLDIKNLIRFFEAHINVLQVLLVPIMSKEYAIEIQPWYALAIHNHDMLISIGKNLYNQHENISDQQKQKILELHLSLLSFIAFTKEKTRLNLSNECSDGSLNEAIKITANWVECVFIDAYNELKLNANIWNNNPFFGFVDIERFNNNIESLHFETMVTIFNSNVHIIKYEKLHNQDNMRNRLNNILSPLTQIMFSCSELQEQNFTTLISFLNSFIVLSNILIFASQILQTSLVKSDDAFVGNKTLFILIENSLLRSSVILTEKISLLPYFLYVLDLFIKHKNIACNDDNSQTIQTIISTIRKVIKDIQTELMSSENMQNIRNILSIDAYMQTLQIHGKLFQLSQIGLLQDDLENAKQQIIDVLNYAMNMFSNVGLYSFHVSCGYESARQIEGLIINVCMPISFLLESQYSDYSQLHDDCKNICNNFYREAGGMLTCQQDEQIGNVLRETMNFFACTNEFIANKINNPELTQNEVCQTSNNSLKV